MSAVTASLCSTLMFVVFVSAGQKNITADTGDNVILPCRLTNKITAVEWSRADLGDEIVFLYQDGQFVPQKQHPSFKNRVALRDRQMKDGDVSLILKDVTTADSGTYKCRVKIAETNSWKYITINLSVSPVIKTIPVKSGQNVILPCRAPKNNQRVKWSRADLKTANVFLYQDGHFVPDHQHPSFKNRVLLRDGQMKDGDVSLILKNVTINDAGTYECRVFMEERRTWKLLVIIKLRVDPPGQKNITAESGQDVTLTCRVTNKITAVEWSRADLGDENVFLYQDGQFVPQKQHPSFKNRVALRDRQMKDGDASLILKDVTTADSGTYKCRVKIAETNSWKYITINLSVSPVITSIPVKSGQNITLPCRAPNNNKHVMWSRADLKTKNVFLYRDGHFVPDNQHPSFKNRVDLRDRQMKDGDVSLILKNVTFNDAGTYVCHVLMEETRSVKSISIIKLIVDPGRSGGQGGSVGLIIGLIVAAVVVSCCCYFCCRRKTSEDSQQLPSQI
ncbi:carcinoembryonic antigen-related cell adhesion molecule 8-like [Oreochromis aureus]|uniref:Ig-like domain-containing protein n=1 Tax=Oreochromis aureus TaxID=47969 RepID=A0AAZ1X908_OREAU|nr:carcinoembryonic antigen-related cell adhesion molecule 8-like [Oreochromis aureus]